MRTYIDQNCAWKKVIPNNILAELRHIEDYDDIYGFSKTYDIETFKIDGEGYFCGKFASENEIWRQMLKY